MGLLLSVFRVRSHCEAAAAEQREEERSRKGARRVQTLCMLLITALLRFRWLSWTSPPS